MGIESSVDILFIQDTTGTKPLPKGSQKSCRRRRFASSRRGLRQPCRHVSVGRLLQGRFEGTERHCGRRRQPDPARKPALYRAPASGPLQ